MGQFETREDAREWMVEQIDVDLRDKILYIPENHIDDVMKVGPDMARISCYVGSAPYDYSISAFNRMDTPGKTSEHLVGGEIKFGAKISSKDGFNWIASGEANLTAAQLNFEDNDASMGATIEAGKFVELEIENNGIEIAVDLKKLRFEGSGTKDADGIKDIQLNGEFAFVPHIIQPNVGVGAERIDDEDRIEVAVILFPGAYGTQAGTGGYPRVGTFYENSQSLRESYHLLETHNPDAIADLTFEEYSDHVEGLVKENGFPNQEAIFRTVVELTDPAADVRREGATQADTRNFLRGDYVKTERDICPTDKAYTNWEHETAEQGKFDGDPDIRAMRDVQLAEDRQTRALGYNPEDKMTPVSLEQAQEYTQARQRGLNPSDTSVMGKNDIANDPVLGGYDEGQSPAEIAAALGIQSGTIYGQGPDAGLSLTPEEQAIESSAAYARAAGPLQTISEGGTVDPLSKQEMIGTLTDPQVGKSVVFLADKRYPDEMNDLRIEANEQARQQEFLKRYEYEQSMRPQDGMPLPDSLDPAKMMMRGPGMGLNEGL